MSGGEVTAAPHRIAVFDRYWTTGGGGERFAVGLAASLRAFGTVTVVGHEAIDLGWLTERFGVALDGIHTLVVDDCDPVEEWSASFDLLVNASYRSHGRSGARAGLYVVHFPDDPDGELSRWQRTLLRMARLRRMAHRGRRRGDGAIRCRGGFHEPDVIRQHDVRWTDGLGRLEVMAPSGGRLRLQFGRFLPGPGSRDVSIEVDGIVRERITIAPGSRLSRLRPLSVTLDLPASSDGIEVVLRSEADRPLPPGALDSGEPVAGGDMRRLGVAVTGVRLERSGLGRTQGWGPLWRRREGSLEWIDSYDVIAANSEFTRNWIREYWSVDSVVLWPPVALRAGEAGPRDRVILSVGRFFAADRGHSKQQLEMVRAFRSLCAAGHGDWTLHLVGGCADEDRDYLDAVRSEAEGLPVEFHIDATGAELDALYRTGALYWHAAGLGVDVRRDPVRAEHFGITTCEAMSAGLVPVVADVGGQREVVRNEVDGFTVHGFDELVARTVQLIDDDGLRARMGAAARRRAVEFGPEAFGERLTDIVRPLLASIGDAPAAPDRDGRDVGAGARGGAGDGDRDA